MPWRPKRRRYAGVLRDRTFFAATDPTAPPARLPNIMQRSHFRRALLVLAISPVLATAAGPAEPLLRKLPAGVAVEQSTAVSAEQAQAIGQKLGGKIERLTNSHLRVHGRPIQVNVIVAADAASATAMHAALLKIKPPAFCPRKGRVLVEYVGRDVDAALATKTSYELGLTTKPERTRYRVQAQLATVQKADYMACNPLFQHFLAEPRPETVAQIKKLSHEFEFGRTLVLRNPKLGKPPAAYRFQPASVAAKERGDRVAYSFQQLPNRHSVPYVNVTMEITVDGTGLGETSDKPVKALTAATLFWPADDPDVVAVARQITAGKTSNEAKAQAILQWLTPGKNIKYAGPTGSRWGTAKVLQQRFGHCWDFSDCFVTLARAAGVPSRQVAGWLFAGSGHVWAEFYRPGRGWQQVDPTGGGELPCGIYHIPYFTSDDGEMPILYVTMPQIEVVSAD